MAELEVLHDVPRFGIAAWRNLAVAVWRDAPRLEWLGALRGHGSSLARRWPDGTGFLNLIVDGTPRFSEDARAKTAEVSGRERFVSRGTAYVVLLDGLRGIATRAFLNTVFLRGRPRSPTQVFTTLEAAAPWLAGRLGEDWTAAEIHEVAHACLERLGLAPDPARG